MNAGARTKGREGGTPSFPNHYMHVSNTFYTEPDKKFNDIIKTIFVVFSLSNIHDDENFETYCRSNVIMYKTASIYRYLGRSGFWSVAENYKYLSNYFEKNLTDKCHGLFS